MFLINYRTNFLYPELYTKMGVSQEYKNPGQIAGLVTLGLMIALMLHESRLEFPFVLLSVASIALCLVGAFASYAKRDLYI